MSVIPMYLISNKRICCIILLNVKNHIIFTNSNYEYDLIIIQLQVFVGFFSKSKHYVQKLCFMLFNILLKYKDPIKDSHILYIGNKVYNLMFEMYQIKSGISSLFRLRHYLFSVFSCYDIL